MNALMPAPLSQASPLVIRQEYFSARELASLAADRGIDGFPTTERGVQLLAKSGGWDGSAWSRKRAGRGGGIEYHFSLMPDALRNALEAAVVKSQLAVAHADQAEADRRRAKALAQQGLGAHARQVMEARAEVLTSIEGYGIAQGQTRAWAITQFLQAQDAAADRQEIEARRSRSQILTEREAASLSRPLMLEAAGGFALKAKTILAANDRKSGKSSVSRRTIYNWFQARDADGVVALAPAPTKAVEEVPAEFGVFLKFYARPSKPTASDAHVAGTVNADYGNDFTGRYAGYAWVRYYDGSQTVADPMLLAKYGSYPERPWATDMIGRGICYAIVTFRYNREIFSSFPTLLFQCGGIKVYDPRKDSTAGGSGAHRWGNSATYEPSRNNAVLAYNIVRGITISGLGIWGGSVDGTDLPTANWFSAMNTCDTTIGTPAVAQYRGGLEVRVDQEPAAIIEELLKGCSGEMAEVGGQFKIRIGGPGLPVYIMSDDDVIVTKAQDFQPFPGAEARMNGIDAKYPDPATIWATKAAPSRYNTTWEAEDGGRRVTSLSLPSCPFPDQVQRVMAAYIADERRHRKHQMMLPPDAAILEPLDVISWTSVRNGYSSKQFDIAQIGDDPQRLLQQVSVREVDPADYAWSLSSLIAVSVPSARPVAPVAQSLTSWSLAPLIVTDDAGSSRRPGIEMSWAGADLDAVGAVQYQVRVQSTGAIIKIGTVSDVASGRIPLTEGIVSGVTYEARAIPIAPGRPTAWTAWAAATAPDVRLGLVDLNGINRKLIILGPLTLLGGSSISSPTGGNLGTLALGAMPPGGVWLRGLTFEARKSNASNTFDVSINRRRKYAGAWDASFQLTNWTISNPAWQIYTDQGTLSGAWEDFEYSFDWFAGLNHTDCIRNIYLTAVNVAQ